MSNIRKGNVYSTTHGEIIVLEVINGNKIKVRFIEYPYETTVNHYNLKAGVLKNPMRPSVCGIGYIGVGPYRSRINHKPTRSYSTWRNMLSRVYKPFNDALARNYSGTSVHPHWHNFQNFAEWYHQQIDHFGLVEHVWDLDKDLLVPGNRIYGPFTSCMIPKQVNVTFVDHAFARGNLPLGVMRNGKGFTPCIGSFGKNRKIGTYRTITEAQLIYWEHKFEAIRDITIQYWKYIPEPLAFRFLTFGWKDAVAYYGDDACIWSSDNQTTNKEP